MHRENCGKEIGTGVKLRPGRGGAAPEQQERKKGTFRSVAALALAAIMLMLVLTGCGKKDRFASPQEYYRHVETAAIANAVEQFGESYDDALRAFSDAVGGKVETEMTLELFKPAADMLKTYTGLDFSWLKSLGLTTDVNLAEDGVAVELALSLNGRELIGMEVLANAAEGALYGRVPLLSEEYFQTEFDKAGYRNEALEMLREMSDALPDVQTLSDLMSRCAEAALEHVGDVKQGSDTLTAGGVSVKYTTLTVTLDEDALQDMAEDVCKILGKDGDLEDFFLGLEELYGEGLYDDFLDTLDELPDRIGLEDDIVMTLYVGEDDVVRGRVIEYDDYIFRHAVPEERGEFGFELSLEEDDEISWIVSGSGERDDETLSGKFVFEADETEMFTISVENLDVERQNNGLRSGKVTVMPTYEYYKYFGVYSLTARAMEDFSYTLNVGKDDAAFEVYMDGDPFLTLTVRGKSGPPEALPTVSGAKSIESWSRSLVLGGGLNDYLQYLTESDIPPELLNRLLGSLF